MTALTDRHAPHDDLERHRPRLFGIAYRMLGDVHEAEDAVQEAMLRWHREERSGVESPEAWLVAVTTRLAIDRLRRAETERAAYQGPWLPEPVTDERWSPDRGVELASDLSMAFLVLLERLAPEERAAFLLREVFDADYADVARALGKSEAACRQMVHRARERVRTGRRRVAVPAEAQEELFARFVAALERDDEGAMLALFAEEATFTSDGGGKVPAARKVVAGPERIARLVLGLQRKFAALYGVQRRVVRLNGEPTLLTFAVGRIVSTTSFATDGERILAVYNVLNPDKLRRVADELGLGVLDAEVLAMARGRT
jgi:RNA polymerase sigma-70 factor (ECF subfamily)